LRSICITHLLKRWESLVKITVLWHLMNISPRNTPSKQTGHLLRKTGTKQQLPSDQRTFPQPISPPSAAVYSRPTAARYTKEVTGVCETKRLLFLTWSVKYLKNSLFRQCISLDVQRELRQGNQLISSIQRRTVYCNIF